MDAQDVHRALNEGRFVLPALLFALTFGVLGSAMYGLIVPGDDASALDRNLRAIWICLAVLLILYSMTLHALNRQRNRMVNEPAEGLIVLMRFLPETLQALTHNDSRLVHSYVIVPDPRTARANAAQAVQDLEAALKTRKLEEKVHLEKVANTVQSHVMVGKVGECIAKLHQQGVRPQRVVVDVTDAPGHVIVDLIQTFGGMIQAFQVVPKKMKAEVEGLEGHVATDHDFVPGTPLRFRATEINLEVAPDGVGVR